MDAPQLADCLHLSPYVLQEGPAPDVWLQLLEDCAADPTCQPPAMRSLAQQLAEQRALTAELQQQVSDQQQQITGLQGSLSAQQHGVAELAAGLQGQLQELCAELHQMRLGRLH